LAHYTITNVVFIKAISGDIFPRLVHITPDIDYLKAEHYDVSKNSISSIDKKFSGWVQIFKWDGSVVREFYLKKGKINRAFSIQSSGTSGVAVSGGDLVNTTMDDGTGMCDGLACFDDVMEHGDEPWTSQPDNSNCSPDELLPISFPCPVDVPMTPDPPQDPNPGNPGDPQNPNPGNPQDPDPGSPVAPYDPFSPDNNNFDPLCYLYGQCSPGETPDPSGANSAAAQCAVNNFTTLDNYEVQETADINNFYSQNPVPCHGSFRNGNVLWPGNQAHKIIQVYYLTIHPGSMMEFIIPGAGAKTDPETGLTTSVGYADLANPATGEMFEIKPVGQAAQGQIEVNNYISKAGNGVCPPTAFGSAVFANWRAGVDFADVYLTDVNPSKLLHANLGALGVIQYERVDKSTVPNYTPVTVPSSVLQEVNNLLARIAQKRQQVPSLSVRMAAQSVIPQFVCDNGNANIKRYLEIAENTQHAIRAATLAADFIELGSAAMTDAEAYELLCLLLCL